jgi:hypothetical protein
VLESTTSLRLFQFLHCNTTGQYFATAEAYRSVLRMTTKEQETSTTTESPKQIEEVEKSPTTRESTLYILFDITHNRVWIFTLIMRLIKELLKFLS